MLLSCVLVPGADTVGAACGALLGSVKQLLTYVLLSVMCAQVLDFELQKQLVPYMKEIVPLPGMYSWVSLRQGRSCSRLILFTAAVGQQLSHRIQTKLWMLQGCVQQPGKVMTHTRAAGLSGHQHRIQVLTSAQAFLLLLLLCLMCAAGIYDPAFIAANQESRADNIIKGSKQQQVGAMQHCNTRGQASRCPAALAWQQLCICMGLAYVHTQDVPQGRGTA
jgi:hypothetical protein